MRSRPAPAEIVRRQVRITPYPHEDSGWIVRQGARSVPLFLRLPARGGRP